MNLKEKILTYAETHDCEIKTIENGTSAEIIDQIDEDVKKINELGGTNKVVCIVIENCKAIYIQSEDNGDKVIYTIKDDYAHTKSVVEGLSVYCKANDLIYKNIKY